MSELATAFKRVPYVGGTPSPAERLVWGYRFHRQQRTGSFIAALRNAPAAVALQFARDDVLTRTARYPRSRRNNGLPFPSVTWQADNSFGERIAYVDSPEANGFRFVGRVVPQERARSLWDTSGDTGWYTDPYGDHSRDGWGLCWGVVYQLPGRNGESRFVAGYQFGSFDGGPTLDCGTIYTDRDSGDATSHAAAQEAAHAADELARIAADRERDYQRAWCAGMRFKDLGEEVATLRESIKDDLAARRTIKADMARVGVPLDSREWGRACSMFAESVGTAMAAIGKARATRDRLADGRGESDDSELYFSTRNASQLAAFREAAGLN